MQRKTLYTVSNAHLDTQWNWTIQDTIRDCVKNTLEKNFALLETHPDYRFNFEGAFRYALAKEYYPDLYARLQGYFDEGRWNFAGSSWDAADANCPSSEAFMRQILYGNGFIEQEFGPRAISKDIFLPDCFGFRSSLPSIAAHMGLIGFSTQKLMWGVGCPRIHPDGTVTKPVPKEESDLPMMDLGRWRGPDGKDILVSLRADDYTYNYDREPDRPIAYRRSYLDAIRHNEMQAGVPLRMMYYGAGDYGGAPSEGSIRMIEEARQDPNALFEVKFAHSTQIFEDLTPEQIEKIPVYEGGLLIPHGYGAMVSHTASKRFNRKNELLADAAEKSCSMATLFGADYPKTRLTDAWKRFLWHQFHDDMTGTSIGDAYTFSYNDYAITLNAFASELKGGIDAISRHFSTDTVKGTPILVFTPASTAHAELITLRLKTTSPFVRVYTMHEKELPSQCKREGDDLVVKFTAMLSAVSVTLFDVREESTPCNMETGLFVTEKTLDNARYHVEINENGDVSRIYDKEAGREVLSAPIHFEIMPDTIVHEYPAWEYDYEDFKKPYQTLVSTPKIEIEDNGCALVSLKITRHWGNSDFVQIISLTEDGQRVDFYNEVQWQEKTSMLRVALPTTVKNSEMRCDLGLGVDKNPTSEGNYPYYQYLVHQWADLTDEDGSFGVALLNDCKYSMDKPDDSTMRLTLIRTPGGDFLPRSAQDFLDWGENRFTFSVASHPNNAETIPAEAELLNQPACAYFTSKHPGTKTDLSLVQVSDFTHLIRCVKMEEKGSRLVVRVQETAGKATKGANLLFVSPILTAVEANGYETPIDGEVRFDDCELTYDLEPYGTKTFLVTLAPLAQAGQIMQTPLDLPYDRPVTTSNSTKGAHSLTMDVPDRYGSPSQMATPGDDISIPVELFRREETAGGVTFRLGPTTGKNALVCRGQTIALPAGTKRVSLLVTALYGDKIAVFKAGNQEFSVKINDHGADIGAWDMIATGSHCFMKHEEIGVTYSHTHDLRGDRLYRYCNLFKIDLDVDGETMLTLPENDQVLVFAATALNIPTAKATAPLYDTFEELDPAAFHTLTVNGACGSGRYLPGRTVLLHTNRVNRDGEFVKWDGNVQSLSDSRGCVRGAFVMGNEDAVVSVIREKKAETSES